VIVLLLRRGKERLAVLQARVVDQDVEPVKLVDGGADESLVLVEVLDMRLNGDRLRGSFFHPNGRAEMHAFPLTCWVLTDRIQESSQQIDVLKLPREET
jgi:hypothetical protein